MPLKPVGMPAHTQQRLDKALHLALRLCQMVQAAPPAGAQQAAFTLARCVVAHSLDYDAGVLSCSTLLHHARAVDEAVMRVVAATLDMPADQLAGGTRGQLCLPARCAGMQLDLPSRSISVG